MVYRDRVVIQEFKTVEGELSDTKKWVDVLYLNGALTTVSTNGQANYQQLRNSDTTYILEFAGKVKVNLSDFRFRILGEGYYKPIEPPKHLGHIKKKTRIAVEVVTDV